MHCCHSEPTGLEQFVSPRPALRWHGLADRARLHTQSVGVGEGRYLTIGTAPLEDAAEGGGAAAGRVRLNREQAALARFIYDGAMMVSGTKQLHLDL